MLVEELLGYRMRKEHSAVDWSKRPLPESWLHYAALDVEMLLELRDVLADQLSASGKAEWARQEFAAWAAMPAGGARVDPWRRTSGIHRVRGRRGLAVVKAMWEQRDALARQRDTTAARILPDAAIVEAAAAAPKSRRALGRLGGFTSRGAQRYLTQFYAAVAEAAALPEEELPSLAARADGPRRLEAGRTSSLPRPSGWPAAERRWPRWRTRTTYRRRTCCSPTPYADWRGGRLTR